ncbi:hypothetical protein Sarmat_00532 [Rickettsiales endosymbiont of Paramecium tredecaurelia]|uniref:hypothetical protein n=1 Tax=Candidatus Sarmatiella mevalonica TaxID=2770581 RepID=UPI0019204247|nr:hypothetical protein [Candidatus Sarmatiella mevalonica]MBL3284681.1 hypothetical protein [Candidatus Sarmatiella mevalonica]
MFIRVLLFIFLQIYCASNVYAWNLWDAIEETVCGKGTEIQEKWGGQIISKGYQTGCPPYFITWGRRRCLLGQKIPTFTSPLVSCIQAPKSLAQSIDDSSDISDVVVQVMWQTCPLGLICAVQSQNLRGNGDCLNIFDPWTFYPFRRICIRLSVPEGYDDGELGKLLPADAGYTRGVYIDENGETRKDPEIKDDLGNVVSFNPLKMCGYLDPGLISGFSADIMDFNPTYQPMHKTSQIHPIFQIIESFVKYQEDLRKVLVSLLTLFVKFNPLGDAISAFLNFYISAMDWVTQELLLKALDAIGSLNRVVEDEQLGCINVPNGPFPPPYCENLSIASTPNLESICESGQRSTIQRPCVVSNNTRNNLIHNAIRVTFNRFVPLCNGGGDKAFCVEIKGFMDGIIRPNLVHQLTKSTDIINICKGGGGSDALCFTLRNSNDTTSTQARVLYSYKMGAKNDVLSDYYHYEQNKNGDFHPIEDCTVSTNVRCQAVWGINLGDFKDVALVFPVQETSYSTAAISQSCTLIDHQSDTKQISRTLTLRIPRIDEEYQSTDNICLYEQDQQLACVNRAKNFKTMVYDCNMLSGFACTNSHLSPQFIAQIQSDSDYTATVVKIPSVNDGAKNDQEYTIHLAGYQFNAFATDKSFVIQPFLGHPKALNASTIYGRYADDQKPYDVVKKKSNPDAVYLDGLEYINGVYARGADYACLNPLNFAKCNSDDTTGCVLSKLKNTNIFPCKDFNGIRIKYPGLRVCIAQDTKHTEIDQISRNGVVIKIKELKGTPNDYCYIAPNNQEICVTSYDPQDRIDPPGPGYDLSESQYYDNTVNIHDGMQYDQNTEIVRSKTPKEMGLCVDVPWPFCKAVTNPSENDGNATWPQAQVGESVYGRCAKGFSVADEKQLTRVCLADRDKIFFDAPKVSCKKDDQVQTKGVVENVSCLGASYSMTQENGKGNLVINEISNSEIEITFIVNDISIIKSMKILISSIVSGGCIVSVNDQRIPGGNNGTMEEILPHIHQKDPNRIFIRNLRSSFMISEFVKLVWDYKEP